MKLLKIDVLGVTRSKIVVFVVVLYLFVCFLDMLDDEHLLDRSELKESIAHLSLSHSNHQCHCDFRNSDNRCVVRFIKAPN